MTGMINRDSRRLDAEWLCRWYSDVNGAVFRSCRGSVALSEASRMDGKKARRKRRAEPRLERVETKETARTSEAHICRQKTGTKNTSDVCNLPDVVFGSCWYGGKV